ncbi:hypothetical protein XNC3_1130025 [Xenorhabdus nematophila F1]|nr:hypothetical protein XNC3_1130025 [Xenorhabdus nematophila F1]
MSDDICFQKCADVPQGNALPCRLRELCFAIAWVILTGEQITDNYISMVACASNRVNVSAIISALRFSRAQRLILKCNTLPLFFNVQGLFIGNAG